jgi:hypothetical protein
MRLLTKISPSLPTVRRRPPVHARRRRPTTPPPRHEAKQRTFIWKCGTLCSLFIILKSGTCNAWYVHRIQPLSKTSVLPLYQKRREPRYHSFSIELAPFLKARSGISHITIAASTLAAVASSLRPLYIKRSSVSCKVLGPPPSKASFGITHL